MNLSKSKVKYICEINKELGIQEYYKQVYLSELQIWGAKRRISKQTFDKRKHEGCPVEYRKVMIDFSVLKDMLLDIDSLIDLSLQTYDENWFVKLCRKRQLICKLMN